MAIRDDYELSEIFNCITCIMEFLIINFLKCAQHIILNTCRYGNKQCYEW